MPKKKTAKPPAITGSGSFTAPPPRAEGRGEVIWLTNSLIKSIPRQDKNSRWERVLRNSGVTKKLDDFAVFQAEIAAFLLKHPSVLAQIQDGGLTTDGALAHFEERVPSTSPAPPRGKRRGRPKDDGRTATIEQYWFLRNNEGLTAAEAAARMDDDKIYNPWEKDGLTFVQKLHQDNKTFHKYFAKT